MNACARAHAHVEEKQSAFCLLATSYTLSSSWHRPGMSGQQGRHKTPLLLPFQQWVHETSISENSLRCHANRDGSLHKNNESTNRKDFRCRYGRQTSRNKQLLQPSRLMISKSKFQHSSLKAYFDIAFTHSNNDKPGFPLAL